MIHSVLWPFGRRQPAMNPPSTSPGGDVAKCHDRHGRGQPTGPATLRRRVAVVACSAVVAVATLCPAVASAATPQEIDNAITKAKQYLYSQQRDGDWEWARPQLTDLGGGPKTEGGISALALWALLEAGEKRTDPRLSKAIDALIEDRNPSPSVYASGTRTQMLATLPQQDRVQKALQRERALLLRSLHSKADARGFYGYAHYGEEAWDLSISQFGVLGMWSIDEVGFPAPNSYWAIVDRSWRNVQRADGGWSYKTAGNAAETTETLSMTAAGVATLFLINDFKGGDGKGEDPSIVKGIDWIESHFDQMNNPQAPTFTMGYFLAQTFWGLERVGLASGYKYFGKLDWYDAGADLLIKQQKPDGSWEGKTGIIVDTSFALLFLQRGQAPLLVNKMRYTTQGPGGKQNDAAWNDRPRDIANVTRWLGKQLERDLRWQVMPMDRDVSDWHDAPICYFAGDSALKFTPEQEAKIKQYIEEGGLVVGHADGGSREFIQSFKALGAKLFSIYEFRSLKDDHAIYNSPLFPAAKWRIKPQLSALGNGSRELMILLPDTDPAKIWQARTFKVKPEQSELMADLMIYPVEITHLPERGETNIVKLQSDAPSDRTLRVARIEYDGNWDPEPYGWTRLTAIMRNTHHVTLDVSAVKLGEGKLTGYDLADMTGTSGFDLLPSHQEELKKFVDGGGTLLIDAAGGSTAFGTSAQKMLSRLYGDKAAALNNPLPGDAPLYSDGPDPMKAWDYRRAVREKGASVIGPKLGGIDVTGDGRPDVFFSAEDLASGLVGTPTAGIFGYTPATATEMVERILLSATKK